MSDPKSKKTVTFEDFISIIDQIEQIVHGSKEKQKKISNQQFHSDSTKQTKGQAENIQENSSSIEIDKEDSLAIIKNDKSQISDKIDSIGEESLSSPRLKQKENIKEIKKELEKTYPETKNEINELFYQIEIPHLENIEQMVREKIIGAENLIVDEVKRFYYPYIFMQVDGECKSESFIKIDNISLPLYIQRKHEYPILREVGSYSPIKHIKKDQTEKWDQLINQQQLKLVEIFKQEKIPQLKREKIADIPLDSIKLTKIKKAMNNIKKKFQHKFEDDESYINHLELIISRIQDEEFIWEDQSEYLNAHDIISKSVKLVESEILQEKKLIQKKYTDLQIFQDIVDKKTSELKDHEKKGKGITTEKKRKLAEDVKEFQKLKKGLKTKVELLKEKQQLLEKWKEILKCEDVDSANSKIKSLFGTKIIKNIEKIIELGETTEFKINSKVRIQKSTIHLIYIPLIIFQIKGEQEGKDINNTGVYKGLQGQIELI